MVVIFVDHYTVLGLPTGEKGLQVSTKDIQKAYKLKALELHPDKKPNNPNAAADFQKLQVSFDVLKNEHARKVFNHELMLRLRKRREQFVKSVVKDSWESDLVSSLKRNVDEIRKRKRAHDEVKEMLRRRWEAEKKRADRMRDAEKKRADAEKKRADAEKMRADAEKKRADAEKMRADRMRDAEKMRADRTSDAEKMRADRMTDAEKMRADRMSIEYEKRYRQGPSNFAPEHWEIYQDIHRLRESLYKRLHSELYSYAKR